MASFDSDSFSTDAFDTDSFDFVTVVITVQYASLDIEEIVFDTLINTEVIHQSLFDASIVGTESIQHSAALTSFREAVIRSSANEEGEIIP